jgi:hypothetical protein
LVYRTDKRHLQSGEMVAALTRRRQRTGDSLRLGSDEQILWGAGGPVYRVFSQSGLNFWSPLPGNGRREDGQRTMCDPGRPADLAIHLAPMSNANDLDGARTIVNQIHDPVITHTNAKAIRTFKL